MIKEDTTNVGALLNGDLQRAEFQSIVSEHNELVKEIQLKMTELGVNATQLALKIGFSKSKVSEILNRKRPLSKRMAKALFDIGISSDVLFKALIEVQE